MKKSFKKLKINRNVVTVFTSEKISGRYGLLELMCNSVDFREGGISCHVK